MRLYNRIQSVAGTCLLSFKKISHRNGSRAIMCRLLCLICAAAVLVPSFTLSVLASAGDNGLSNQSIELNLNTEKADSTVKLNGLMPNNAVATVTDVTGDYEQNGDVLDTSSVIAAYDITITHGGTEYQPGEKSPIHVEIAHPQISSNTETQLWHIKDDGTREEIKDFTVEDGKLSFYATGFSIYEIVEVAGGSTTDLAQTVADLTSERAEHCGFYLYYGSSNLFTSSLNDNNALVETTNRSEAATWFFEESNGKYKLYTYVGNQKMYLHQKSGNNVELSTDKADLLEIQKTDLSTASFNIKLNGQNRWLQHSESGGGIRYWTAHDNAANSNIFIEYTVPATDQSIIDLLDGKYLLAQQGKKKYYLLIVK